MTPPQFTFFPHADRHQEPDMSLIIHQVDAFTSEPFGGNPAAVVILPEERPAEWMQKVAIEMNLSETAFLLRRADGFGLRWFTPGCEVKLCGHATLASAHVLYSNGILHAGETARFHTLSGLLTARLQDGKIELDFPALPVTGQEATTALMDAMGTGFKFLGANANRYLLAELENEDAVRAVKPDFGALVNQGIFCIMVTSRSNGPNFDFISRFFAPGAGINEDPVTGSAHCSLTPFWAKKLGRNRMNAYQASARGGVLEVELLPGDRVALRGNAVTTLRGELFA